MNLIFNKLKLKNFQSYDEAEICLKNQGFCKISGKNYCKQDASNSNGVGKSTLFSALCFCLTGETLAGLKQNLKNINVEDNNCFVSLDLSVDNNHYIITRTHKPKSDLKIIKNNIDISGKTYTESCSILANLLPDLTKDLISSTILLGQGNNNKFSSLSPSGRKNLLEQLTKSDFMIEDIKQRLANRKNILEQQDLEYTKSLTANNTSIENYTLQLSELEQTLKNAVKPDFGEQLNNLNLQISEIKVEQVKVDTILADYNKQLDKVTAELLNLNNTKLDAINKLNENFINAISESKIKLANKQLEAKNLQSTINYWANVKDVCPTCGQKLINVVKKDTSTEVTDLANLELEIAEIESEINKATVKKANYLADIDNTFSDNLTKLNQTILDLKKQIAINDKLKIDLINNLATTTAAYNKISYDQQNWDTYIANLDKKIIELKAQINKYTNLAKIAASAQSSLQEHLAIVKNIETLIKRDFRSYLLKDIITYINQKAKEYCEVVFQNKLLELAIDGNNLNISYNNKNFDSLSGGEKQRVDIIIQCAIRDLLQTYLKYTSNIIVLDEIFDALDSTSTDHIIKLITTKLKDIDSIFIISHHSEELQLPVDTEIQVVKSAEGISSIF